MQHITHEQTDSHVSSRLIPASTRLRRMLADQGSIISAPGVYDGITARLALAAGFKCLYMTGAGTSMARLGMPDIGLATFTDMLANASMLAGIDPGMPVIADADAGFGGPIMVHRVVQAYARAGVAALHIEDQVVEKQCGQGLGALLVSREVWYAKLRAAVTARDEIGSDMVIIARTDANAEAGFDEAMERLRGARECGVDALYLEAPKSVDECRRACEVFAPAGVPMLASLDPGTGGPNMTAEDARALGFRIVVWPKAVLETVFTEGIKKLKDLKDKGAVDALSMRPDEMLSIFNMSDCRAVDAKAAHEAFEIVQRK